MATRRRVVTHLPWILGLALLVVAATSTAGLAAGGETVEITPAPSCSNPSSCTDFDFSLTNGTTLALNGMTIQLPPPTTITGFSIVGQPAFVPSGVQNALVGYPLAIPAGKTVTGSGTASAPLAPGTSFKVFFTSDGFLSATGFDVALTIPVPNCDVQRAAVAAAQAKVDALQKELNAAGSKAAHAAAEVSIAKAELESIDLATLHSPIVALVGAVDEAEHALGRAENALEKLRGEQFKVESALRGAKLDLADAQAALKACESGHPDHGPASVSVSAAPPATCGAQQLAYAAATARRDGLAVATKRFKATGAAAAETALHAAIAPLTQIASDPRAASFAAKLRGAATLMRSADGVLTRSVHAFAGLAAAAKSAAGAAATAKAALITCQHK